MILYKSSIVVLMAAVAGFAATPVYEQFESAKGNGSEPTLPDFSYAGYKYCEEPIPDVAGPVFDVTSYGAVPDDGNSDQAAIKRAITAAEAANGGVIYFPAGQYLVNTDAEYTGSAKTRPVFTLSKGGIVFRGDGDGDGGTEIKMVNKLDSPSGDECMYCTPFMIEWIAANRGGSELTTITADAAREQFEIEVASTAGLSAGQWINLGMGGDGEWYGYMDPYAYSSSSTRGTRGVAINEKHQIASISGRTVRFKEPLHNNIKASHPWKVRSYGVISGCGFEDIKFSGNWNSAYAAKIGIGFPFVHHRSADDDGAFSAIKMKNVIDSWVRRCTFHDWNRTIEIESSSRSSVVQIKETGSMGHSSGATRTGYGVLLGDYDNRARHWHGVSACYQAAGTVLWRCKLPGTSVDCHGGCPYATLSDNMESSMIADRNGGADNVLPHHLRWYVLWNWKNTGSALNNYSFWQHRQQYVKPIVVGNHGNTNTFEASSMQLYESPGVKVTPGSLFEEQLKLRLGAVPGWIQALAGGNVDVTPPAIRSVTTDISGTKMTVGFNEAVEKTSAETAANYSISPGITVTNARLLSNGYDVELTVTALTRDASYTLDVSNVKDVAVPANTIADGTSYGFTYELCTVSSAIWQPVSMEQQNGAFTVTYDATPLAQTCNGLFTLSGAAAGGFGDCAVLVRFNNTGTIDARNGGDYAAVNTLAYALDTKYRFEVAVDVAAHRYDVTVTPDGGAPVIIAANYAFRTEQASVSTLRYWNIIDDAGSFKICNVDFAPTSSVRRVPARSGDAGTPRTDDFVLYSINGRLITDTGDLAGNGPGVYLLHDTHAGTVDRIIVLK